MCSVATVQHRWPRRSERASDSMRQFWHLFGFQPRTQRWSETTASLEARTITLWLMPFLVLKTKYSQKKKQPISINLNHSWLLLELLILTTCHIITIWFYHHRIQKWCSVSDPCHPGSQELGKWNVTELPRLSGDHLAAAWPCARPVVGEPCSGKVEPGCGCWQWWCSISCPSRGQLEAESMTHGAAFPGCSHHITASEELEKSQRQMRIPPSGGNPQDEGSAPDCERQQCLWAPISMI